MTDPIAYENGVTPAGEQLDVYDVLALVAQDALADTAAAADEAANSVLAADVARCVTGDDYLSLGEWLNEQDESSEDYYEHDDFSFLPPDAIDW